MSALRTNLLWNNALWLVKFIIWLEQSNRNALFHRWIVGVLWNFFMGLVQGSYPSNENIFTSILRGMYRAKVISRLKEEQIVDGNYFFLAWPLQDVFLLPLIPWIEQGSRILLFTLLYDLCDGLTIFTLNGRSEYRSPTLCLLMNHDCNTTWDNKLVHGNYYLKERAISALLIGGRLARSACYTAITITATTMKVPGWKNAWPTPATSLSTSSVCGTAAGRTSDCQR